MIKRFKGGTFQNRYVIMGVLTAEAPFHIGSGNTVTRPGMKGKEGKDLQISGVVTDRDGKPYIPGSSLRGVMRDWLRQMTGAPDREEKDLRVVFKNLKQKEIVAEKLSLNERLFGTTYGEGKAEIRDAPCITKVADYKDHISGWDKKRLTYVAKSVAINPKTGTAEDKKLYNFELVPGGAQFRMTITAQNLSDEETALLFYALNNGFEHAVDRITIGAMTKRGFGRFSLNFKKLEVYRLNFTDIEKWKTLITSDHRAGYESIIREDFKLDAKAPSELEAKMPASSNAPDSLLEEWKLKLETPLVVRSGGVFGYENSTRSKTRNYQMKFQWNKEEGELNSIADLYFSLKIEGDKVNPYYHIPSSSIRGSLRAWTITHLLPRDWWDIEKMLKENKEDLEKALKENTVTKEYPNLLEIVSLFGFTANTGISSIDREFTRAGRLTIETDPFQGNEARPEVDGEWNDSANHYGPVNAKRHIKPRCPIDRITHAAKDGGLHNSLEFSAGQAFALRVEVKNPNEFDKTLIEEWKKEINEGMIRFGALSGIGRGRVSIEEAPNE